MHYNAFHDVKLIYFKL